jgi:hypothetical protein
MIRSAPRSRASPACVMAVEWEPAVPEIVEMAGFLPRPVVN